MKGKLLLTALLTLLLSPLTAAKTPDKNNERIHYRCHLMLSDKSEVVHGFVSVGKTQSEFEQALPGRIVFSADGVTGLTIENLYQCVKAGKRFNTYGARELEAKTLF